MKDLIRKRDIDYISAPIAPVLKGENVHYEYVAFRKQIEDISPVSAIPIPNNATNGDMIKALFPTCKFDNALPFTDGRWETVEFETDSKYKPTQLRTYDNWWNSPYKRGDTEGKK